MNLIIAQIWSGNKKNELEKMDIEMLNAWDLLLSKLKDYVEQNNGLMLAGSRSVRSYQIRICHPFYSIF